MLLAFGPEDLERLAIPIGVGIAGLIYLVIPSQRKRLSDHYEAGREFRKNHPMFALLTNITIVILFVLAVIVFAISRK